ncbi:MAG: hypothetical protein J4F45_15105, partial [Pseudomonadales bacterium]|nr:hypothetical protein [Pseudomonadales bacterium]
MSTKFIGASPIVAGRSPGRSITAVCPAIVVFVPVSELIGSPMLVPGTGFALLTLSVLTES